MKGGYCRLRDRSVELSKARAVMGKFWCLKHGGEDIGNGRMKRRPRHSVRKGKLVYKGVEVTYCKRPLRSYRFCKSMVFYTHIQTP